MSKSGFTKDELNIVFIILTGVLFPELEIIKNLKPEDLEKVNSVLLKLDRHLQILDGKDLN